MFTIFIFLPGATEPVILRRQASRQTLLEICSHNNIPLRHDCGGICACSTCHVVITEGGEHLPEISRREAAFLRRVTGVTPQSRLACQCLLTGNRGSISLHIPGQ